MRTKGKPGARRKTGSKPGKGKALVLKDGSPVPLPETTGAWRIEKGPVHLDWDIGGRRHRLARFEKGEIIPATDALAVKASVLVSGDAGAALRPATGRQINKRDLAASSEALVRGIAALVSRTGARPGANVDIAATGPQMPAEQERLLASPGRVVWLVFDGEHAVHPCGLRQGALQPDCFPLHGNLWAGVQAAGAFSVCDTAEVAASGKLASAITALLGALPDLIEGIESLADSEALDRIEANTRDMSERVTRSLAELEAVGPGMKASGMEGERDATAAAVRFALQSLGFATRARDIATRRQGFAAVPEIARAHGVRAREVLLTGSWWREDLGPIVARGDDGEVVALVREGGSYVAVGSFGNERVKVTTATAETIHGQAFALYPPLPSGVSGMRDIARFLVPIVRSDIPPLLFTGLVIGLVGLLLPLATAVVFDTLIPGSEVGLLIQVGIGLACAALLVFLMSVTKNLALLRINGRSASLLNAALWDKLLKLPAGFFKDYSAGDLNQRISGFETIRSAVLNVVLSAVLTAVFSIFYLGLLFFYDVRLALIALALVAVFTAITFIVGLMQIKYLRKAAVISGELSGFVFQLLQGIVKLRIAGAEARGFARWAGKYAEERRAIVSIRNINNHFGAFTGAYAILSLAAIFAAAHYLSEAAFTPGIFIAFVAAFTAFQTAFLGLSDAAISLFSAMPALERGKPILEAETEENTDGADPGLLSGAISVSHVTFAYEAEGTPVLRDVSFDVAPGEQVAVVGPSGSGKSTLLRVLLGFEKPQSGTVLYDNQDLGGLDKGAVRRQIGVVLQTGRIFAGSIVENIRGAGQATLEECMQAAVDAGFAEDLALFPMGLHTPLTEGASTISGGQKQRILIARALASKPRILFMDEATSALDNRTQAIVTRSLNRLSVTRVVIAHRLSTVRDADRIVVIEDGELVEKGTFEELMVLDGAFARLAERQLT